MPDAFFDADQIRAASFIRHVEIHDTLGSTNDRAVELARDPYIAMPALVVAQHQTAGRGRGQNAWWSVDGALTISILLDTVAIGIGAESWPQLSLATAVAICDALAAEAASKPVGHVPPVFAIKWPNDVLLNERKVCGILIESPGGPAPAKDRLIIGIGVNVNNSWRDAPREILSSGIAIGDVTNIEHVLGDTLLRILIALEQRLSQLAAGDPRLPRDWQQQCSLRNRNVSVESGERTLRGMCCGIADDGALIVRTAQKKEQVYSGSVHLI